MRWSRLHICTSFATIPLVLALSIVTGSSVRSARAQKSAAHSHETEPGVRATPYPDRVTLTWADDPSSTLSVSWRTDSSVTNPRAQIVRARAEPTFDRRARTVEATTHPLDVPTIEPGDLRAPYRYHSVTFSGLQPDSTYAYRVGDGTHWSEWFHARTASDEPEPFSFIYLGDAQNDIRSKWARAIREAYSASPDASFMVHVGDLVNYADRNVQWAEWHRAGDWIQGTIPTLPVPGNREYSNHEGDWDLPGVSIAGDPPSGRALSVHWRPQFALPQNGPEGLTERAYYLDHEGMRLIGLDAMAGFVDSTARARQTEWLESVLADTEARWTVVAIHIPIFSTVGDFAPLREAWQPLLEKHGVDLVMQGHNHNYARGRVENVATGENRRASKKGPVYVTSVSGGKMLPIQDERWTNYKDIEIERSGENTQLFQVVHVGRDTLKYRSYTVMGEHYDAFDLVQRSGDTPNEMIDRVPPDRRKRTLENTIPPEESSG